MHSESITTRFWNKVDTSGGPDACWLWTGARSAGRYGSLRVNGQLIKAHRLSWEMAYGLIPDGVQCLHHCDVPLCVNPQHLFLGTPTDNMVDMTTKGRRRGPIGEDHPRSVTTAEVVRGVREAWAAGATRKELAERFGLTTNCVRGIIFRVTWKHLP